MTERDDHSLLLDYAESGSEPAFAILVERYLNLVHSAALRRTGDSHAAGEIAQAVFIILARKAGKLGRKTILSGWLYQTALHTAANYLRGEIRRQRREQEAYVQSILNEPSNDWAWQQIAPQLEAAMAKLRERDRHAIVLRFFENKSLAEVGAALGASEDAAKMRVNRALEKLRKIFAKRGVVLTTAVIAGVVSVNSVQAAPVGLAKTISTAAIAKGAAAGTSTFSLVKGTLKMMTWTQAKTAVAVAAGVLLGAGATSVVWHDYLGPDSWRHRFEATYELNSGEVLKHIAPPYIPERSEYYHKDKSQREQAKYAPQPPSSFIFRQSGHQLKYWMATYGAAVMDLSQVSQNLFQIGRQDLEGPAQLLDLPLNGDWTFRAGASRKQLIQALEAILHQETGRNIQIEPLKVERKVLVAHGVFSPEITTTTSRGVDIYAEKQDRQNGLGSGSAQDFLKWLAGWLDVRIVDELPAKAKLQRLDWRISHDSMARNTGDHSQEERHRNEVLDNVERQTGLSFTEENRQVEVWFVSEQK